MSEVPKGSIEAGHRVKLPRGATEPIRVYVNGVLQERGGDYDVLGSQVVFTRQILKEEKLKGIRRAVLLLGVVGNYVTDEHVDIEYELSGSKKHATDVPILPD